MMLELLAQRSGHIETLSTEVLADELRHRIKDLQVGCTPDLLSEIDAIIAELVVRATVSSIDPRTPVS